MDNQQAIIALEERIVQAVGGEWRTDVEAFKEGLISLAATVDGHDLSAIIPQLTMMLAVLRPSGRMDKTASEGVAEAHAFGVSMASRAISTTTPKVSVAQESVKAVDGLNQMLLSAIDEAHRNLVGSDFTSGGMGAVLAAVRPVTASPNKVETATAWAVNNAANSAVHNIAEKLGKQTCWIAERDACLNCTAYNGVYNTGGEFPPDLTYADKPLPQKGPLLYPPLHPRCRCQVEINITPAYADALKREAVRSVLKGISTDTESDKARIAAAQRLLDSHPDGVPATVVKYAKTHIKKGSFK